MRTEASPALGSEDEDLPWESVRATLYRFPFSGGRIVWRDQDGPNENIVRNLDALAVAISEYVERADANEQELHQMKSDLRGLGRLMSLAGGAE